MWKKFSAFVALSIAMGFVTYQLIEFATRTFPDHVGDSPFRVSLYIADPTLIPQVRIIGWVATNGATLADEDPGNRFFIQVAFPASAKGHDLHWTLCVDLVDREFETGPVGAVPPDLLTKYTRDGVRTECYGAVGSPVGYISPTSREGNFEETDEAYGDGESGYAALVVQGSTKPYGTTIGNGKSRYVAPGISDIAQLGRDYAEPTAGAVHFGSEKRAYYAPDSEEKLVVMENVGANSFILASSPAAVFTGRSVFWRDSYMENPWLVYSTGDGSREQGALVLAGVAAGLCATAIGGAARSLGNWGRAEIVKQISCYAAAPNIVPGDSLFTPQATSRPAPDDGVAARLPGIARDQGPGNSENPAVAGKHRPDSGGVAGYSETDKGLTGSSGTSDGDLDPSPLPAARRGDLDELSQLEATDKSLGEAGRRLDSSDEGGDLTRPEEFNDEAHT